MANNAKGSTPAPKGNQTTLDAMLMQNVKSIALGLAGVDRAAANSEEVIDRACAWLRANREPLTTAGYGFQKLVYNAERKEFGTFEGDARNVYAIMRGMFKKANGKAYKASSFAILLSAKDCGIYSAVNDGTTFRYPHRHRAALLEGEETKGPRNKVAGRWLAGLLKGLHMEDATAPEAVVAADFMKKFFDDMDDAKGALLTWAMAQGILTDAEKKKWKD